MGHERGPSLAGKLILKRLVDRYYSVSSAHQLPLWPQGVDGGLIKAFSSIWSDTDPCIQPGGEISWKFVLKNATLSDQGPSQDRMTGSIWGEGRRKATLLTVWYAPLSQGVIHGITVCAQWHARASRGKEKKWEKATGPPVGTVWNLTQVLIIFASPKIQRWNHQLCEVRSFAVHFQPFVGEWQSVALVTVNPLHRSCLGWE